ncbi:uncharacterized protein LOC135470451 isoform X2 [Liolophura sinensis]|uniref:uncharacterized protein LOC135470451 isoform X2 n=1 Tax=Liolophura sinensis TaxID=3198878 RepID=UPI003158D5E7
MVCVRALRRKADLHCSVQATNIDCLSTAFSDSHNWPGKPEHLNIQSHSVSKTDNRGFVGVNITWRTPSDVSATYVTGFEVSLNLIGSNVFGVRTCYVFNLTRATNTSRVILQELVDSVFTLQCQVPAKAEGIFTQLYSLPKPKKKLLQKRVYKYFKFEAMRATASPNPCDADPQI